MGQSEILKPLLSVWDFNWFKSKNKKTKHELKCNQIILDFAFCHLAKENSLWRNSWTESVLSQVRKRNYNTFSLILVVFCNYLSLAYVAFKMQIEVHINIPQFWWNSNYLCCISHNSPLLPSSQRHVIFSVQQCKFYLKTIFWLLLF